jgi:hypothetical protein
LYSWGIVKANNSKDDPAVGKPSLNNYVLAANLKNASMERTITGDIAFSFLSLGVICNPWRL